MESFIEGFWLGVGAAVPLGPINVMIMQEALKRYPPAVAIGAGAMSADLSYLTLILIGLTTFAKSKIFITLTTIFGSIFLLYMAYSIYKSSQEYFIKDNNPNLPSSISKAWLKGYLMTLLNPYTILFWISLSAYIGAKGLNPILTILGLVSAITIWITLMPLFIHKSRHLISQRVAKYLSYISAGILLFFAISMLWYSFI